MLLTKEVELHWSNVIKKYYVDKGYIFTKRGDSFICNIEDLSEKSTARINVKCDYCGRIHHKQYKHYIEGRKAFPKDCCSNCANKKTEEILELKYGDRNYARKLAHIESMKKNDMLREQSYNNLLQEANRKGYILLPFIYVNTSQKVMYLCKKHINYGIKISTIENILYNECNCNSCLGERISNRQIFNIDTVRNIIEKDGMNKLLSNHYTNANAKDLSISCALCNEPYTTSLQKFQGRNQIICPSCRKKISFGENSPNWKGGVSSLNSFLRCSINEWKQDSLKNSNYQCDISKKHGYLEVHHLHRNFKDIVDETLKITNLDIRKDIGEYTQDELDLLYNTCLSLHYKYGLGVCILREYHLEFHDFYGRFNNTPEQYYKFKKEIQSELFIENQSTDSLLLCSNE